jgi:hypothetical protein
VPTRGGNSNRKLERSNCRFCGAIRYFPSIAVPLELGIAPPSVKRFGFMNSKGNTMKTISLAAVLFLTCSALLAGDESAKPGSLRAKPVQIVSCAEMPAGVGNAAAFLQHKVGFQIHYLIEGEDLIGIKPKSLVIDSITTPAGKDISKQRNGHTAYEQGSFPKASEDGKYCIFSLECADARQFGQVEKLVVKGSITALVASNREEKKLVVDVNSKQPQKVGPFTIQCGKPSGGLFGGFTLVPGVNTDSSSKKNVGVKVAGPMQGVIDIKFKDEDRDLEGGYSYDDKGRDYTFPKPKSGKLTVTVSYWADLREAKVQIGQ